jgi:hypothetical protein
MKKFVALVAFAILVSLVASCASTLPVAATSNPVGSKVGVASTTVLFYMFCLDNSGNTGVQKAAEKGGIKKISTVDIKTEILFPGVAIKRSCIVTGE